ncbi:MAG: hypothetical protein LC775_07745, partial [Acidobacteria bacterium]|nr:hypothetical protein [Acidobacteriota bacterium]
LADRLAGIVIELSAVPPTRREDAKSRRSLRTRLYERQERIHGPEWRYALRLVRLPLAPASRHVRDRVLRVFNGDEKLVVSHALAIVSDCNVDRRVPTEAECATLNTLLTLPLPEKIESAQQRSRRHATYVTEGPILSGRAEAVAGTIRLIGLAEENAHAAARLVSKTSLDTMDELIDAMAEAGYGELARNAISVGRVFKFIGNWLREDRHRDLQFVLKEASKTLDLNAEPRTPSACWRLTGAAALIEALEFENTTSQSPTGSDAVERFPEVVRHLVRIAIPATGLPSSIVADDSRRALELVDADPLRTRVLLHVAPNPLRVISPSTPSITSEDRLILQKCLRSHNDWLFHLGAVWLSRDGEDKSMDILWGSLPCAAPLHRFFLGCWLLAEIDRHGVHKEWLN